MSSMNPLQITKAAFCSGMYWNPLPAIRSGTRNNCHLIFHGARNGPPRLRTMTCIQSSREHSFMNTGGITSIARRYSSRTSNSAPKQIPPHASGPVQTLRGVVEVTWANKFQPGHNMVRLKDVEYVVEVAPSAAAVSFGVMQQRNAGGGNRNSKKDMNTNNSSTTQDHTVVPKHVLCSGSIPNVFVGETVTVTGQWADDTKYGSWLHLSKPILLGELPQSIACEDMFFRNGGLKGIGPKMYQQLKDLAAVLTPRDVGIQHQNHVGVLDIIEKRPELMRRIQRVGPKTVTTLMKRWEQAKLHRELVNVLVHVGLIDVPLAIRLAARITEHRSTVGSESPLVALREDPYRLVRTRLLAFKTADMIMMNMGIGPSDERRVVAGFLHCLALASEGGHCGLPTSELVSQTERLLRVGGKHLVLSPDHVALVRRDPRVHVAVVDGVECCFDRDLFEAEEEVARRLVQIATGTVSWGPVVNLDACIVRASQQSGSGIDLSVSQSAALRAIVASKLTVMTGGPGVGKTKIIDVLVRLLKPLGAEILLCAPTGRAASRLREATNMHAVTLHRLLGISVDGSVAHNSRNPLKCDLVIVDEASMVDTELMDLLVQAMPASAALLVVGDADQLPSVGPGDVLMNLIESAVPTVVRLTEVHRQAAHSPLITLAHDIRAGVVSPLLSASTPTAAANDVVFVKTVSPDQTLDVVRDLVTRRIPQRLDVDPVRDIQVLCPTMRQGRVSVDPMNRMLQNVLNPEPDNTQVVRGLQVAFQMHDKVMQLVNDNDKGVFNGEIGVVSFLNLKPGSDEALQVTFSDAHGDAKNIVSYTRAELDVHLRLAYACTVHKAQGCEFKAVIVVLSVEHMNMLRRSLLYTACTRARDVLYIVGQQAAVTYAVHNDDQPKAGKPRRWTLLAQLLRQRHCPTVLVDDAEVVPAATPPTDGRRAVRTIPPGVRPHAENAPYREQDVLL
eukprot:m.788111 g.788111  ORF g.788111 m.788111 type:complete len:958 (+) comp23313_c0_seq1:289-3162(+)